ncbi:MAG: glutamate--tRNA ligase family protein, partial [Croceibacterium sp.]
LQMFTALGAAPPRFAHEALLVGAEGKLSKRLGSLGCDAFREAGLEPEALLSLLARLGTSQPVEAVVDRQALVDGFDLATFGRAPARFDDAELVRINAAIIHGLPFAAVQHRLPAGMDDVAWQAIRPNLETMADAADWWQVVTGPVPPTDLPEEDRAFCAEAAALMAWGDDPWNALTAALKEATGRKGKALFLPLRLALTGRARGPDMHALLPLIGEQGDRARLLAAASG